MNNQVLELLTFEEGFRPSPYYCSEGYPTIGVGLKIGYKDQPLADFENLPRMPRGVAMLWLRYYVDDVVKQISEDTTLKPLLKLDDDRLAIVISMVYQLGLEGFKGFKHTIKCLKNNDFANASIEMLDSLWAKQTPNRAERHCKVILTGSIAEVYDGYY